MVDFRSRKRISEDHFRPSNQERIGMFHWGLKRWYRFEDDDGNLINAFDCSHKSSSTSSTSSSISCSSLPAAPVPTMAPIIAPSLPVRDPFWLLNVVGWDSWSCLATVIHSQELSWNIFCVVFNWVSFRASLIWISSFNSNNYFWSNAKKDLPSLPKCSKSVIVHSADLSSLPFTRTRERERSVCVSLYRRASPPLAPSNIPCTCIYSFQLVVSNPPLSPICRLISVIR